MQIRYATEHDIDAIVSINVEVQDLHQQLRPDEFRPSEPDELQAVLGACVADEHLKLLVAEADGAIAAYAMYEVRRLPFNAFKRDRAYLLIHQIAVRASCRRRGIASHLLGHLKALAAQQGLPRVEIDVYADNTPAKLFYRSAGFCTYRDIMEMSVEPAMPAASD